MPKTKTPKRQRVWMLQSKRGRIDSSSVFTSQRDAQYEGDYLNMYEDRGWKPVQVELRVVEKKKRKSKRNQGELTER